MIKGNKTIYGTTAWVGHDTYELIIETNRWGLLKWLLRGSAKLRWEVPCTKKRKGIYLRGKKS